MRLFVALQPSEAALADLERAVAPLRETADAAVRWQTTDRWHVTLAFLGEVPDERVDRVRARLVEAVQERESMVLAMSGGGRFGDRVLWVGVEGDTVALRGLARSVARAAREVRVEVERRPFRGHITLARSRGRADLRALAGALAAYSGPTWPASEALLVRSHLGPQPRYEVLDRLPLSGA